MQTAEAAEASILHQRDSAPHFLTPIGDRKSYNA